MSAIYDLRRLHGALTIKQTLLTLQLRQPFDDKSRATIGQFFVNELRGELDTDAINENLSAVLHETTTVKKVLSDCLRATGQSSATMPLSQSSSSPQPRNSQVNLQSLEST